jgi:hypothetical protein
MRPASQDDGRAITSRGLAALAPRCRRSASIERRRWEADERPEPRSLGLLPSGPDPVGEWLVHRQPPGPYIGWGGRESKRRPVSWETRRLGAPWPSVLLRAGEGGAKSIRYFDVHFEGGDRFTPVHLDLDLVGLE